MLIKIETGACQSAVHAGPRSVYLCEEMSLLNKKAETATLYVLAVFLVQVQMLVGFIDEN